MYYPQGVKNRMRKRSNRSLREAKISECRVTPRPAKPRFRILMLMAHEEEFRVKPKSAAQMHVSMFDVHIKVCEFAGGAITRLFSFGLFTACTVRKATTSRLLHESPLDRIASNDGRNTVLTCTEKKT